MNDKLVRPYEISIWEDFTPSGDDADKRYYKERKIAIIGSDKMTSNVRAINPKFKENVNGTHTLTFSLYSRFFDEDINDFIDNPFLPYMVNERKIKLFYKEKWYDFIIKDIEEDSSNDSYDYTCTDSFINELSKNGFSIELDTELENNQGTIRELSESILDGTDWKVGHVDTLVQKNDEALYAVAIPYGTSIIGTDMSTLTSEEPTIITITSNENISGVEPKKIVYVFYTCAMDSTIPMQFLYREDGNYTVDENGVINNAPNYLLTEGNLEVDTSNGATNEFRGKRIVQKELTKYDSMTNHFVTLYEDSDYNELYMYYENEYISPSLVNNYVSNSINFTSTSGWIAPSPLSVKNIVYPFMYDITDYPTTNFVPYMRIKYSESKPVYNSGIISNVSYFNTGIAEGEKYVLRLKYGIATGENDKPIGGNTNLRAKVAKYTLSTDGNYNFDGSDEIISFVGSDPVYETEVDSYSGLKYVYYIASANKSVSYSNLISTSAPIGLFFSLATPDSSNYYFIQEAQFFPYKQDSEGKIVFPGDTPSACVKKKYFYYYPQQIKEIDNTTSLIKQQLLNSITNISDDTATTLAETFKTELIKTGIVNSALSALDKAIKQEFGNISFDVNNLYLGQLVSGEDINDVLYAYVGNDKPSYYKVKYDNTFEKIRSITAKESNRFNLIQSLCETFECWPRFDIEHEENGEIKITDDGPQKTVSFYEYIGKDNFSGFKYGINLDSIKRTLDSEQIVSKIIVKPNSNEYGIDGYCDIARASENPISENFLLNFRYYIQQGLLDGNEVNNDLYLYTEGGKYLGYYVRLNKLNKEYDSYILEYSLISNEIDNLNASYTAFKQAYDAAVEELNEAKNIINNYCGVSYETLMSNQTAYSRYINNTEIQDLIIKIQSLTSQAEQFKSYYTQKDIQKQQQADRKEQIKKNWEEVLKEKEELNYKFYQKYSKYIQEGSWISEDYMDDNLYYLDAENVLYNSAFPEVSYTIKVLELSELEGYENYSFEIGDKTYIEDVEFFGYINIDNVKTPYKEEVILSEITYNLDSPESNEIKIQNYKTQFEDLFQRITATTQSLQYSTGNYQRAASAFNTNGSITQSALQNSMINNSLILSNATDQSVVWDDTGITITNLSKPNEIVRLVSGGILITNNGGETWSAGVTGNGINTSYLTAGQIDASRINIISGGNPSFRWDENGITAYKFQNDETTGAPIYFQFNNFIRLDQYGIYGINHDSDFVAKSIEDVENNAEFGLTWNGFFLQSNHKRDNVVVGGSIKISSNNDFQVFDEDGVTERIKIGLLDVKQKSDGTYTGIYGLRINDLSGNTVMETNDKGFLFLTQKIAIGPDPSLYKYRAQLGIVDTTETDKYSLNDSNPYSLILSIEDPYYEGSSDAKPKIQMFDNGYLVARNAKIHGRIEAESGRIGNLTIEQFNETLVGIKIETTTGITIKQSEDGTLNPSTMKFTPNVTGKEEPIYITWLYSIDGTQYYTLETTMIGDDMDDDGNPIHGNGVLEISASSLYSKFSNDILYLRAYVDGIGYDNVVLTLLKDVDLSGIDVDIYNIIPNYPEVLKYYTEDEEILYSPSELNIKSYKGTDEEENVLNNSSIKYDLYIYSNLLNYYNSEEDRWVKLTGQIEEVTYDSESDTYVGTGNLIDSPFEDYISFTSIDNFLIELDSFYRDSKLSSNLGNYFYDIVGTILEQDNTILKIKLVNKNTEETLAIENFPIKFGTSADMASFALTASNIQMAIRNTGLTFDADGLHIVNGGFDITKETRTEDSEGNITITSNKIFEVVDGQLYLEGNGIFSGTINATNGQFNGTVNANSGTLNNLDVTGLIRIGNNITINGVTTEDNPYVGIYSNNYIENQNTGFYINDNGIIVANQLELGSGAVIKKYIRLGNSWIINPEWLNTELALSNPDEVVTKYGLSLDSFIVVKDSIQYDESGNIIEAPKDLINIKQNGIITIGKNEGIKINGSNQSISSFNYTNGSSGWSIDANEAEFNNITARGSIKSSTFEYEQDSVQSIGGILLIKPSSTIKSIEVEEEETQYSLKIKTESQITFNDGDFAKIGYSDFKNYLFEAINVVDELNTISINIDKSLIASDFNFDLLLGNPLLNMGGLNSSSIVINGSDSNSIYPKSSLSIFENNIIQDESSNWSLNPQTKLVLGLMPKEILTKTYGIFSSNSYGLYAENVFLKGALISEGKDDKDQSELMYSGINTNSNVEFKEEDKGYYEETGKIILWAGAPQKQDGTIDIQSAKFKVDNLGNLYANSGYFVGTIITDATITASKIMTAEIEGLPEYDEEGNQTGNTTALSIKNADVGIKFDGYNNNTIMELNTNGLNLYSDLNVGDTFTVRQDSSLVVPITFFSKTRKNEDITVISPNKVGFGYMEELPLTEADYDSAVEYKSYITNNLNGLSIFENNVIVASFNNNEVSLKKDTKINAQLLAFTDDKGDRVKFQTVRNDDGIIGYDLYLS